MPGWNGNVKCHYELYRQSYLLWIQSGRMSHDLFENMKQLRSVFKKELKQCRKSRDRVLNDKLITEYNGKDLIKFWRTVKSLDSNHSPTTDNLEGKSTSSRICELWATHYSQLFNSNADECNKEFVLNFIQSDNSNAFSKLITFPHMEDAIKSLKSGKAIGSNGIDADSLKLCCKSVSTCLELFFNSCLCHSFLPLKLMEVQIVPILKKPSLDKTKMGNYRPIAIASIVSKVLEKAILSICQPYLHTSYNQFGYKQGVGTEMAVFALKQVAHHYLRNDSPVYIAYLDASKAFDMVNHWTLLRKFIERGFKPEIVKILRFWFRNQMFAIRWNGILSRSFPVRNGTRQGGILSSHSFIVYMDGLSEKLNSSGIGCHIGNVITNHIAFADDYCVLSSSISSLKKLLKICQEYGQAHNITFNPTKTVLQAFMQRQVVNVPPTITFFGKSLDWSENVRYLGYDVSCWSRDEEELKRRRNEIYVRANMLASKFRSCSAKLKKYLFNTFLGTVYCMSLWLPTKSESVRKVKVAFNDAFRFFFNYKRTSSASKMFADNRTDDFLARRRKASYSLMTRLCNSNNLMLENIYNSHAFTCSSLYREWSRLLLGHDSEIQLYVAN